MPSVFDFSAKLNNGDDKPLADYRGKVLLIVNTASRCGNTPQYKGLEELYKKYSAQGLEILAFPCDQFGHQEPGTRRGDSRLLRAQLRRYLSAVFQNRGQRRGRASALQVPEGGGQGGLLSDNIKWNFTKFLVDREGKVLDRFAPMTNPKAIEKDIAKVLKG